MCIKHSRDMAKRAFLKLRINICRQSQKSQFTTCDNLQKLYWCYPKDLNLKPKKKRQIKTRKINALKTDKAREVRI
ncbi:hypothetical protein GCM10008027_25240 [Pseudoalteromonas gelatinilytica]|uniref:Orphan protein n=1 Tax=Pseudoalteromonas gelatinilytica TaxID=1703256 RepID=A0ABQ1TPI1_9GAMM|nr:hypothetical protein GCM10008027_25240 [Pseudoalteromonas profundi]